MASAADTSPSDWRYVSEGGATIVFSYIGPPNPQFDNTVLRLRKSSTDPGEDDDPIIEFQRRYRDWVMNFIRLHENSRPEERRTKGGIDITRTKAVLATDLVGGNWIAVEIKPKWAFLPSPEHLSPETVHIKTKTCRYCMHSRVRASRGDIKAVGYCPLDLFSHEEGRMRRALANLWDSWILSDGSINNLKIFVQGRLIQPSEVNLMWAHDKDGPTRDAKETFICTLVPLLLDTPVLQRISYLQRALDPLDIEGLSRSWREAEWEAPIFSEPTLDDWDGFVGRFLSLETSDVNHSRLDPSNVRYHLLAYLLSATFKDCSIITRLDYLGSQSDSRGEPVRVTVIDLDKKSITRLKQWEKLDKDIVDSYVKLGTDKICVD